MTAVWSDQARMEHWRRIEVLAVQAWARLGTVPEADAAEVAAKASFTVDRVLEIEQVTRHDVAAFVQCLGESVGPAGRWIHFGMTSSDVLDTGFALQLREAAELRLRHPYLSLQELARKPRPPLTKSTLNHRFRRIEQLVGR
jgi:adenylosuccinate lyase